VDDTAVAPGDYASTSGTLTFAPGDTSEPVSVPINGDTTDESHETFKLKLSNPTSTGLAPGVESFPKYAAIDNGTATTTILDDDSTVSVSDSSLAEGDSGTAPMPFTVTLANPSSVTVTVHFQTQNGSAVAPGDYTSVSTTVTFTAGQVSKTVNVPVKGDLVLEPDENFVVNLSAPTNAALGDSVGAGIIEDDD
jgi:chitinase